ncbi:MAG: GNAT family N-acetyltransferase [Acidobacteriota bacterium]|nr:MAG: GNAT family N-acetyltransferase [Acidobacteriota bacterium]
MPDVVDEAAEVRILRSEAELDELAPSWDGLVPRRGEHADLFDTHGWLAAWIAAAPEQQRQRLRVVALADGSKLLAALPLVARSPRSWQVAGLGYRPRFRPVIDPDQPPGELLGRLVEGARAAGARELSFPVMPQRDPATAALIDALKATGYAVHVRSGTSDCITRVEGGWDEQRRRFKKYHRTVNNFANKAGRLGELSFETYAAPAKSAAEAFDVYAALHERGWKGPLRPPMSQHRARLLAWADRTGCSRLHVLRLAGVPTAALIWFRIGPVAIAYSTVYDRRLAALSAGTIAMWWSHRYEFEAEPPELFDYLPGRGSQKSQLGIDRPPLLTVEAVQRRSLNRMLHPIRRSTRRLTGALRRRRRESETPGGQKRTSVAPRSLVIEPSGDAALGRVPVAELDLDARLLLYVACAGGHPSVEKMRATWDDADHWWRVGDGPSLLVRLGESTERGVPIRELILIDARLEQIAATLEPLASRVSQPLTAKIEIEPDDGTQGAEITRVTHAPLPWPGQSAK